MREWKMQEWKMREHIAGVENAGVENTGATKYGKPSEENTLKYQTKISFHADLRRRIKVKHLNLSAFLGRLQHITIDNVSDVSRVTRGLAIRRAKKRVNLKNDKCIKICIADI